MKYTFRGNVVFEYDPETKQMSAGEVCSDGFETNVFNFCGFIPDDFKLFSEFFRRAHRHATGQLNAADLPDIEVN